MKTLRLIKECRAVVAELKKAGHTIGFVPTMGALHAGHLSLVERSLKDGHKTVVSIFVNPTQFGPNEDFARYPRDEKNDAAMLEIAGAHLLFLPNVGEMYPAGFSSEVRVKSLGDFLCGPSRPGHFEGVATVVTKLLNQVQPDAAYFGEKDWQQLQVITHVAADLDVPTRIIGVPILREDDGLAMSSRNRYLSVEDRAKAPLLYITLQQLAAEITQGGDVGLLLNKSVKGLTENGFQVDYLELADAVTLNPMRVLEKPARLFVAARLGTTRLIDNCAV